MGLLQQIQKLLEQCKLAQLTFYYLYNTADFCNIKYQSHQPNVSGF